MASRTLSGTSPGLWFYRDPTGDGVAAWLEGLDRETAPERRGFLVPRAAPLLDRRSAVSNARLLVGLWGGECDVADTITALRTVEIPDRLLRVRVSRLSQAQRLAVWLAIAHLRDSQTTVVIEPFVGVSGVDSGRLARLIREAATPDRTILLVSVDPTVGAVCGALPVRDLRSTPW